MMCEEEILRTVGHDQVEKTLEATWGYGVQHGGWDEMDCYRVDP